jgi:uncharacterized alpha-E superfamily protein
MLSRVAESLFWMGRYMERADGTARILDVHLQVMLEDPSVDEGAACRSLLSIMGVEETDGSLKASDVADLLAVGASHPASIAHSLRAARENGRRAREIISTELWECLNTMSLGVPQSIPADRHHAFFAWVRERTAMAAGISYTTMIRDEPYQFFILGQGLERADMTARLLATRELTDTSGASWTTILRSCGAYESCLRSRRGVPTKEDAAEFLLLDTLFPRSIQFSFNRALAAVRELEPVSPRTGLSGGAEWILGQAISQLRYRPIAEILEDLPTYMDQIQLATSAASNAIKERHFPSLAVPTWVGEGA